MEKLAGGLITVVVFFNHGIPWYDGPEVFQIQTILNWECQWDKHCRMLVQIYVFQLL